MSQPDEIKPSTETPEPDVVAPPEEVEQPTVMEPAVELDSGSVLPPRQRSFLIPALFLLLVGGLLGWVIGRQSAIQPLAAPTGAATVALADAATATLTTTAVPILLNDNQSGASISQVPVGPTPATFVPESLRVMGNPDAPVTIVEFSDYQCPYCLRHFQEVLPQLKTDYIDTGRVYYVYKDYPITSLHPVAPRVHEAARCAGELGGSERYWQAHDTFLDNQSSWADQPQPDLDAILLELTSEIGVSGDTMRECLESGRHAEAVTADMEEGQRLGVNGTPTFFINGYPVPGALPYDVFRQAIAMAEEGRLGEAYARSESEAPPTQPAVAPQDVNVPLGEAPGKGNPEAPVTIVEYSDFQCPFCMRHFTDTLPKLQSYIDAGQVYYVFKDFPIQSIHPQAQKAHESARCARELGGDDAFWQMHDLLFINQPQWAGNPNHVDVFKSLAAQVGISQTDFNTCLESGQYAAAVAADFAEGEQLGIRGTPTFFVNGRQITGALPVSAFEQVIQESLAP